MNDLIVSPVLPSRYRTLDLPADAWTLVDAGNAVFAIDEDGYIRHEVRDRRGNTVWPPPNDFEWSPNFPTRDGVFYFYGTIDASPPALRHAFVVNKLVVIDGQYVKSEPSVRGLFARIPPPSSLPLDLFSSLPTPTLPAPPPDSPIIHAVRAGKTICGADLRPGETFGRPGQYSLISCPGCRG